MYDEVGWIAEYVLRRRKSTSTGMVEIIPEASRADITILPKIQMFNVNRKPCGNTP
jgi:hypothetical protein